MDGSRSGATGPVGPQVMLLVRFACFGVLLLMGYQLLLLGVEHWGAERMGGENGPIEMGQAILAGLGSLCLFWAAWKNPCGRTGVWISASLLAYAAARECDLLFEMHLFDDAYQWVVGLPLLLVALGVTWRYRRQFFADCTWLIWHPAAIMFGIAGIYLCTVCQMLDRPAMWNRFPGAELVVLTPLKSLIEESCELFAYQLLFFAAIEAVILARRMTAMNQLALKDQGTTGRSIVDSDNPEDRWARAA